MASEYARYQEKVSRKKRTPDPRAKIGDEVKPEKIEPRKSPDRKRH